MQNYLTILVESFTEFSFYSKQPDDLEMLIDSVNYRDLLACFKL